MKRSLFLLFIAIIASSVQSQSTLNSTNYGYHRHDGFYLSMSIGPNFSNITNDVENDAIYKYKGTGSQFDLKIGGAINEDFILHGTLLTNSLSGPKVESDGLRMRTSDKITIGEVMIGGGFTYYMMPANTFISASIGLGGFTIDNEEEDIEGGTDKGFSFQIKLGKEWWISKNWGLGIGISYENSNVKNEPDNTMIERLSSNNWGILFNTTFN